MSAVAARPAVLIPAAPQRLWGMPAVINFGAGGLGAGLYVAAVAAAGLARSPGVAVASWLGPALVVAGFIAVATEAGRPLRGPRVLWRVRTSWMSRELWLAAAFVLLAVADTVFPLAAGRVLAVAAAAALALSQGFVLRRSRGVTAWDVRLMPVVFLTSALVSGAGLYLLVEAASGRPPAARVLTATVALLVVALAIWLEYLGSSSEGAFTEAVRPLVEGTVPRLLVGLGYVAPMTMVVLGGTLARPWPGVADLLLVAAGALMAIAQLQSKRLLILAAGRLRPITLPGLTVSRRSS